MTQPSLIRAVCFDVGGTLIDVWPSVGDVYASVARELGLAQPDPAVINARFVQAWQTKERFTYSREDWAELVVRAFGGDQRAFGIASPCFEKIYDRFTEAGAWRIYEDVVPTLQDLTARGIKLAVVSNWDERLCPLLRNLGLDGFFQTIEASGESGDQKPSASIFRRALARLEVEPAEALHVGDSYREDVEGARAAGMQAFWLRRGTVLEAENQICSLLELAMRLDTGKRNRGSNSEA